jgi:hypothetical protein
MGAAVQGDAGFRETCACRTPLQTHVPPLLMIYCSEPSPLCYAASWQDPRSYPQDFCGSQVLPPHLYLYRALSHTPALPSSATFPLARTAPSGTMQLSLVPQPSHIKMRCVLLYLHRVRRQSQRRIEFEHFGEQFGHCLRGICCFNRLECCHRAGCLLRSPSPMICISQVDRVR